MAFSAIYALSYIQIHNERDESKLNVLDLLRLIHRYTACLYLYISREYNEIKVQK